MKTDSYFYKRLAAISTKGSDVLPAFLLTPAFAIFTTAFCLRLILVIFAPNLIFEPEDKVDRYDVIALSLLHGRGFAMGDTPTAIAPPVYPGFLAMVYYFFGYSKLPLRIIVALLNSAQCLLVYEIAKLFFAPRVPFFAATIVALHPGLMALVYTGTSEALFVFLNTLFVYVFCMAFTRKTVRCFFVSGCVLAIATLCRAVSLLLPVFALPVFFILGGPDRKRTFLYSGVFMLAFAAVLTPWITRNYFVFDRFVPVQTHGGVHFYWATLQKKDPSDKVARPRTTEGMDEIEKDHYYYRRGLERIKETPLPFFMSMGERFLTMWYKTHSGTHDVLLLLVNGPLLTLAVIGIFRTRSNWKQFSVFTSIIFYYIALHLVLIALARYLLPVLPLLAIFAAVPVNDVFRRITAAQEPTAKVYPITTS